MKTFTEAISSLFLPHKEAVRRQQEKIAAEESQLEQVAMQYCVLQENVADSQAKIERSKADYDRQINFDIGQAMSGWLVSIHSNCPNMNFLQEMGNTFARAEAMQKMRPLVFEKLDALGEPSRKALAAFESENSKVLKKLRGLSKMSDELSESTPLPKNWFQPPEEGSGKSPVGMAVAKRFWK